MAIALSALPSARLYGFLVVTAGSGTDQVAQGVLSVVTLVLLALYSGWAAPQRRARDRGADRAREQT